MSRPAAPVRSRDHRPRCDPSSVDTFLPEPKPSVFKGGCWVAKEKPWGLNLQRFFSSAQCWLLQWFKCAKRVVVSLALGSDTQNPRVQLPTKGRTLRGCRPSLCSWSWPGPGGTSTAVCPSGAGCDSPGGPTPPPTPASHPVIHCVGHRVCPISFRIQTWARSASGATSGFWRRLVAWGRVSCLSYWSF